MKCTECAYRWKYYTGQRSPYCGYFLDTGQLRNCPVEGCNKFLCGDPCRKKRIVFSEKFC